MGGDRPYGRRPWNTRNRREAAIRDRGSRRLSLTLTLWPRRLPSDTRRRRSDCTFRGSMAGLYDPPSTLRPRPRGLRRTARGRCGSLLVHRSGLPPPTTCRSPGARVTVSPRADPKIPIRSDRRKKPIAIGRRASKGKSEGGQNAVRVSPEIARTWACQGASARAGCDASWRRWDLRRSCGSRTSSPLGRIRHSASPRARPR